MIQYDMSYRPVYGTPSAGTTLYAMCLGHIDNTHNSSSNDEDIE